MACFLVPTTEAIVTTIVEKNVEAHEKKEEDKGQTLQKQGNGNIFKKIKMVKHDVMGRCGFISV